MPFVCWLTSDRGRRLTMALASDDLRALRDYVTAGSNMQAQSESTVLLAVTHSNLKARFMEIRFDRHVRRSN